MCVVLASIPLKFKYYSPFSFSFKENKETVKKIEVKRMLLAQGKPLLKLEIRKMFFFPHFLTTQMCHEHISFNI